MDTNATENAVGKALSALGVDPLAANRLTLSVARSISYDKDLAGMAPAEVEAAVLSAGSAAEHHVILDAVRGFRRRTREKADAIVPAPTPPGNEPANKGFFLQCWHAFRRDGHLGGVRLLTVRFLARWLADNMRWVETDELDWCARYAVRENEDVPAAEKEDRTRACYEETLVLLVMNKFARSMDKNPEKTSRLIDGWEREYAEYTTKQFGHAPDWSPSGYARTPSTSAFGAGKQETKAQPTNMQNK